MYVKKEMKSHVDRPLLSSESQMGQDDDGSD